MKVKKHCREYRIINNIKDNSITVFLVYRTKIDNEWVSDEIADDTRVVGNFTDEKKAFEYIMSEKKKVLVQ